MTPRALARTAMAGRAAPMRSADVRMGWRPGFITRFALCIALLALSFAHWESVFASVYLYPLAATAATLLNLLGVPTVLEAHLSEGFCALAMERELFHVTFECTGILSLFIYLSAVAVYPATMRQKMWGVLCGPPAFFVYTSLRLVALGLIGQWAQSWLSLSHLYLMVLLNLGFMLLLWSSWIRHGSSGARTVAP